VTLVATSVACRRHVSTEAHRRRSPDPPDGHPPGQRSARHPFRVLGIWLLVALAVLGLKSQIGGTPTDSFTVPGVESQRATDILKTDFPSQSGASGDIVFHVDHGKLADAPNKTAIESAIADLRTRTDVAAVTDPFDPRGPTISADGATAYATINYTVTTIESKHSDDATAVAETTRHSGIQTELTGSLGGVKEIEGKEGIGLIVAVIVLLVAFGSLIAMGIPIGTALIGLAIGLAGVGIMAGFVDVPTTSPLIASMIGLGVGIDYALFVVTRHRQHLHAGMSVEDAAGQANATAGQSVLFAGMTVVIAITGLVMAGIPAIASMGFAAAIVVFISMCIAVTLLPAFLGLAGRNIDRWALPHRAAPADGKLSLSGRWAHHVGKRPWRFALASLAGLLALAAPVMSLRIGFADDSNTAASSTQHKAYDLLSDGFGKGFNAPLLVVVQPGKDGTTLDQTTLTHVHEAIANDSGIAAIQPPMLNASGDTAVITALPTSAPQDAATADTVARLRHDVLPAAVAGSSANVMITGQTAMFTDISDRLTSRLPYFIAAVVMLSFILLMIVFRSIMVPLKAALMNLLSIGAAYGVIVAIFQWGWAKGLVGVHATIPVNPFVPMIMFAILFGLSMDYEVFLLSRVREEYQRTGDSHTSVVDGLASTARVITSAALIMISVFLAFVASDDVTVKMFGIGLATAVLIDATLVRMVLVPSTMSLLGSANWWLPNWLDRILPHMDLEGSAHPAEVPPATPILVEVSVDVDVDTDDIDDDDRELVGV
jgi:putative drug exporter of the RND superfamily